MSVGNSTPLPRSPQLERVSSQNSLIRQVSTLKTRVAELESTEHHKEISALKEKVDTFQKANASLRAENQTLRNENYSLHMDVVAQCLIVKKFPKAVERMETLLKSDSLSSEQKFELNTTLSKTYLHLNQLEDAEKILLACMPLAATEKQNFIVHTQLSAVYFKKGDYKKALDADSKSMKYAKTPQQKLAAYLNLSKSYLKQKKYEEAVIEARNGLALCASTQAKNISKYKEALSEMISQATSDHIKELLEKDAQDPSGNTALHYAAQYGYVEEVEKLVKEKSGLLNRQNRSGDTALHIAACQGNIATLIALKKAGADETITNQSKKTAQNVALYSKQIKALLIFFDLNPDDKSKALFFAIAESNLKEVQSLLQNGANAKEKITGDMTPLHIAALQDHPGIVKALIDAKADVDAENKHKMTPLHIAAKFDNADVAKVLIDAKAKADKEMESKKGYVDTLFSEDDKPCTPFHIAARYGSVNVAKVLIDANAYINDTVGMSAFAYPEIPKCVDYTPLHVAIKYGQEDVAELLIKGGAFCLSKWADPFLHFAAKHGNKNIAELLIKNGENVHMTLKGSGTPLHVAAKYGNKDVAELLVSKKANVNAEAFFSKNTPLHYAATAGIAKLLIDNGANVNAEDRWKLTPLHYAATAGIAKLLIDNGANVNAEGNTSKQTPLHCAARSGRTDVALFLIDNKADIHAKNGYDKTPLHLAAQDGHLSTVKALLKKGAKIENTELGTSPLWSAKQNQHMGVVKFLKEIEVAAK